MTALEFAGWAAVVTVAMACVDYAHARYTLALQDLRRHPFRGSWWRNPRAHTVARWSVVTWAAASVGFAVAVGVTLWITPFEGLGLYLGSLVGSRDATSSSAG